MGERKRLSLEMFTAQDLITISLITALSIVTGYLGLAVFPLAAALGPLGSVFVEFEYVFPLALLMGVTAVLVGKMGTIVLLSTVGYIVRSIIFGQGLHPLSFLGAVLGGLITEAVFFVARNYGTKKLVAGTAGLLQFVFGPIYMNMILFPFVYHLAMPGLWWIASYAIPAAFWGALGAVVGSIIGKRVREAAQL